MICVDAILTKRLADSRLRFGALEGVSAVNSFDGLFILWVFGGRDDLVVQALFPTAFCGFGALGACMGRRSSLLFAHLFEKFIWPHTGIA